MRISKAGADEPLGLEHRAGAWACSRSWLLLDLRLKALTGVGTADIAILLQRGPVPRRLLGLGAGALCRAGRIRSGLRLSVDAALCGQLLLFRHHRGGSLCAPARAAAPDHAAGGVVPLAGALCDAAENALQLVMLLNGATDTLARAGVQR